MIATSKVFSSKLQSIFSKIVLNNFSQSKNDQLKNLGSSNKKNSSGISKPNINIMTKNINFEMTNVKNISEVTYGVPMENHLKKIQKTATIAHCFNPFTHHEEDVPIRIFRTHYTVSFLPSVQFLENEFSENEHEDKVYLPEKDSVLSVYKFSCTNCGHQENRFFPENGFKFGTVITGCD